MTLRLHIPIKTVKVRYRVANGRVA